MNIEPLQTFLEKEISPSELAKLLDELMFDYIDRFIYLLWLDNKKQLHPRTANFLTQIGLLREALLECDK